MTNRTWKLLDLLNEASSFFESEEIENPRLQAELLLAAVLDMRRLDLYLQFDRVLTEQEVIGFREYAKSRRRGTPVQYITGTATFRLLDFEVSDAVLIPRPETEVIVDCAQEFLEAFEQPRVLDLGCGSGAIAISIAYETPAAVVFGVDIDPGALLITKRNAETHNVSERVGLICTDLLTGLSDGDHFDAIICNPPYIPSGDIDSLESEVREFEPHRALDGGVDGLDYYSRLAVESTSVLEPGGVLFLEVGDGQERDVVEILEKGGCFAAVDVHTDLTNTPRIILAHQ